MHGVSPVVLVLVLVGTMLLYPLVFVLYEKHRDRQRDSALSEENAELKRMVHRLQSEQELDQFIRDTLDHCREMQRTHAEMFA